MNDLDPAWLRSFAAIAQAGSVTRAAQQVHRTQSAVSTHLQQLEAALGARLVERTTRALSLTQEGERFLPHARRLLDLQAQARAAMQPVDSQLVWSVGISEYFLPSKLGELLGVLRDSAPDARFELMWSSSAPLQRLWQAGEADLVIVTSARPVPGARLLRREPLAWVAAAGYALPVSLPAPLVLLGPDCPVREIALSALVRSGRAHHVQLNCTGSQAAVAAIRAGWGVGCLNVSAVPPDLEVWSRKDPRRWPSPGRLAFYLLAKPELRDVARGIRSWIA
jgi:DNA-binding transcriptional LysR family regulator